jgi:hypothetical protein
VPHLRDGFIVAKMGSFPQSANLLQTSSADLCLEGVISRQETGMKTAAIFVAIFAANIIPMMLILSGESKEAQDKARARRLADARMNARLLRLNL